MKKYLFLLLLFSCTPNSPEDFQVEGEVKTRQLIKILEKIETKNDLFQAKFLLRKKLNEIVGLMVSAQKFQEKHPDAMALGPNRCSQELLEQLRRIYAMDGGREILELIQAEVTQKISLFGFSPKSQNETIA